MDSAAIPELDRKGLRDFGVVTGAMVAGIFGVVLPWLFELRYPTWPWIFLAVFATWGLAAPMTLRPVYRVWMRFGLLLSKVTTPIILGAVFVLTIVPVALILRVFKWDAMRRQMDPGADTYRVTSEASPRENLEKPY